MKLLEKTANSLSFERATPSAHQSGGPAEKLHYRFAEDHVAIAIETQRGKVVEMRISAFERLVARDTVLHWSDGEITDFGVDAIGVTYHGWPSGHKKWKKVRWVFFRQGKPYDGTVILLEFPEAAEVRAGTHSQLYFTARVKSGEPVKMYFLSAAQLAEKHESEIDAVGIPPR